MRLRGAGIAARARMLRLLPAVALVVALLLPRDARAEEQSGGVEHLSHLDFTVGFPTGVGLEYEFQLNPQVALGFNAGGFPMVVFTVGLNFRIFFPDFGTGAFYLEPSAHALVYDAFSLSPSPLLRGALGYEHRWADGGRLALSAGMLTVIVPYRTYFIPAVQLHLGRAF